MRMLTVALTSLLLAFPLAAGAQDGRAALQKVAEALGADNVTSIEYAGSGVVYAPGQSATPGAPWPKFGAKTWTRTVNYDTQAFRDSILRTQMENPPRGGGVQPVRGEVRQTLIAHGEFAYNMVGDTPAPAPVALAERQFQLWTTPHGIVKAALAGRGSMKGNTISIAMPGRFKADALVGKDGLIEKVSGVVANAVVGDLPIEIAYADYKDFGGVRAPTKITQTAGGHPSLDVTITDVHANLVDGIGLPAPIRATANPYARVTTQKVADGVWYLTGGTHHSVAIELKDSVLVVEGPLTEARAFAVINEVRTLVPTKPIRGVVATHHHFDHSGGLRAFAAVNVPIIAHESAQAFWTKTLNTKATIYQDQLTNAGTVPTVEAVGRRRVISDGTRRVEIHHIANNLHADDLLMVYLPKEKILIEADVYTPLAPNAQPPMPPSPFTVSFADHLKTLGLDVSQIVPIHGRAVPFAELHKTIGR
ncbi:MAG: MBL fold metallo-hydrolase [Candidatus Rokubacteria bacterium]|nr:MBL fold metallo-hydrolase [Candidatus Rokubacteria bacterium]